MPFHHPGEAVKTKEAAKQASEVYVRVMDRIASDGLDANVSLKFTQLGQAISEPFLAENLAGVRGVEDHRLAIDFPAYAL